jgi:hypothetical protein
MEKFNNDDNIIISNFKKSALNARLSNYERNHIRDHIIESPYMYSSHFWSYRKLVGVVAILTLLITGGGASLAASNSLPGEKLYVLKVHVNEEVKELIAISPDAKVKVAAERVKERLEEAEKLSMSGKLNTETKVIIKNNIKKHTDKVKDNVNTITAENKSPVSATKVIDELKISLDQHEAALEIISLSSLSASSTEKENIGSIINSVIEAKAEIENVKKSIEATSTTKGGETKDNKNASTTSENTLNASTTMATDTNTGSSTPIILESSASSTIKIEKRKSTSTRPRTIAI